MRLHSSCVPPLAPASLSTALFVCTLLCALHRFECTFQASLGGTLGGSSVPAVAPPRDSNPRPSGSEAQRSNRCAIAGIAFLPGPRAHLHRIYCHLVRARSCQSARAAIAVSDACACVCVCAFAETSFFSLASCSGPRAALCLQLAVPPTDHHQPEPSFLHQKGNHYKHIHRPHRLVVRFDSFVPRLPFTRCWASTQRNFVDASKRSSCQQSSSNKTGAGPAKCGC